MTHTEIIAVPDWPRSKSSAVARSMRSNRRRDTSPELEVRSALHRRGYRFRVDYRIALERAHPRPDIAFTRLKIAIFVDGCFWHCCPEHGHPPKTNGSYWGAKLARNVQRDQRDTAALAAAGWQVLRFWEHVPFEEAVASIEAAVEGRRQERRRASRSRQL